MLYSQLFMPNPKYLNKSFMQYFRDEDPVSFSKIRKLGTSFKSQVYSWKEIHCQKVVIFIFIYIFFILLGIFWWTLLCQKLKFSNHNIVATQYSRTLIFQTMNSVRSTILSFKHERFTPSGCNDIGVRTFEFGPLS